MKRGTAFVDIVIDAALVVTMVPRPEDALGVVGPASVLVRDGLVHSVGVAGVCTAPTRIDGRGMILLPGLVNCHNHVSMTLLRGYGRDLPLQRWLEERIWPAEERMDSEDVHIGALVGCLEMLRGGTTAFADMYMFMDDVARAVETSGIRGCLGRGLIGLTPGWEARVAEAADFCARWQGGADGRITTMMAPHAEYTCPRPLWVEAVRAAREVGVRLHTHVSETVAEVTGARARHGCSPVRFLEDVGALEVGLLAAHCVHVDAPDLPLLARPGVAVSTNPISNAKLGSGIAPLTEMVEAGVVVGFGSDGAASTDFLGMWEEMRLGAWLQKATRQDAAALAAEAILRMATVEGSRALGLGPQSGTIAPGAPADLILVDLDGLHQTPHPDLASALVYGVRDSDVRLTMVAGRVVMRDGRFPGIDLDAVRRDASRRSERLVRTGGTS